MLKLVTLTNEYELQLRDMMDEWTATGETIVPYSIGRIDYKNFSEYVSGFHEELKGIPDFVPATTLFCLDTERNIFVGAVNIRHYLNNKLLLNGGHIGDGIRPSERRKGYATKMIELALGECKKLGINRVLMVCNKDNIGSAKSIIYNGGILENEINIEGNIEQRYWIQVIVK